MKPEEDRRHLYLIAGIVLSVFLILMALTVASQRTSFFGRASAPGAGQVPLLSRENSYIFASPVAAFADGESIIRVTVFLLNNQGLGVGGQSINLKVQPDTNISSVLPVTDNLGRAIFDLTSSIPGDYTISAEVEGGLLPQTVSISFR